MTDSIDIRVGKNLRKYRKLAGLTQQELGDQLGITQQQIVKYETGQNAIVASRLYRIAEVLDIPIGALFADEDEESDESPASALIDQDAVRAIALFPSLSERQRVVVTDAMRTMAHENANRVHH